MSNPSSSNDLFAGVLKPKAAVAPEATLVEPVAVAPVAPVVEPDDEAEAPAPTEIDMLKTRARLMGIQFSNNIGLDSLKAKVQAKMDGVAEKADPTPNAHPLDHDGDGKKGGFVTDEQVAALAAVGVVAVPVKSARQEMMDEQMKLVRLRITNLNPSKKDMPGEIFVFANRVIGAVKKFVPYGETTDNGWHLPWCIYQQLKEREFLNIKTRKDSRGRTIVETGMAREFALEVLEPLTEVEISRLAAAQAAAAGQD